MTKVAANDGVRPPALTPPGCDLRNFLRMPMEVGRLLASETWIEAADEPRLGHALISLWCEAWRQVPAGSLPNIERTLQRLSMCPNAREWAAIRDRALAGWHLCTDGRLYHPVVSEMALEAWLEKLRQRKSSGAGNAKRHGGSFDPSSIDAEIASAGLLLSTLNPNSPALQKRGALAIPPGVQAGSRSSPGGSTPGVPPASGCDPGAVPAGSQGKGREGNSPQPPTATSVDNFGARLPAGRWWETRSGIEAAGAACGIDRWDEEAFGLGRGEHWPAYRERVLIAAGEGPWLDSGVRLPAHAAGLLRVGGVH